MEKIIERRRERKQPINGTPKLLRTVLEFGDFKCFPTMFPRVYPNGDVFYPCEPLKKIAGNLLQEGSFKKGLRARSEALRRHSRLPRDLPSLWECRFFVLREGFLGIGGRLHPVGAERKKVKRQSAKGKSEKPHTDVSANRIMHTRD